MLLDVLGQRPRDAPVVDNAGAGYQQGGKPGDARLERGECRARDLMHLDIIELTAYFQITEALHLDRCGGDNEFAAVLDRNAVLSAKLLGFAIPSAAQACFQGARCIVHTGVNDSAVMTGLVGGNVSFLLEQHQTGAVASPTIPPPTTQKS